MLSSTKYPSRESRVARSFRNNKTIYENDQVSQNTMSKIGIVVFFFGKVFYFSFSVRHQSQTFSAQNIEIYSVKPLECKAYQTL